MGPQRFLAVQLRVLAEGFVVAVFDGQCSSHSVLHTSALPFESLEIVGAVPTVRYVRKAGKMAFERQLVPVVWKFPFLSRALKCAAQSYQESQAGTEKFPYLREFLAEEGFCNPYPSTGTEKSLSGIR